MKKILLLLLLSFALTGNANAAVVVDQFFFGSRTFGGGNYHGQTFEVGLTGQLTQIDVWGKAIYANTALEIISTNGGIPSTDPSDILASVPLSEIALTPDLKLIEVDLRPFDLLFNSGDIVAFAFNGNYNVSWGSSVEGEDYTKGTGYVFNHTGNWEQFIVGQFGHIDLSFRTHVDTANLRPATVPEPTTMALMGLGLAGAGFLRRKKK